MAKDKALGVMTLEELEARRATLAEQRTELRLAQREVEDAIAFRKMTDQLPPDLRNRVVLQGAVEPNGEAKA